MFWYTRSAIILAFPMPIWRPSRAQPNNRGERCNESRRRMRLRRNQNRGRGRCGKNASVSLRSARLADQSGTPDGAETGVREILHEYHIQVCRLERESKFKLPGEAAAQT